MAYFLKAVSICRRPFLGGSKCYSSIPSLVYSEEVLQGKMEGKPIVALESTIITHGMPYPQNLETAIEVENIVRQRGAIPATVAILQGQLTMGLSEQQLTYLAQAKGVVKASRRDMAPVAAAKLDGATTVAGTLVAAGLANIPVFVTGGIGGVHREGESTLDISADLTELGRSSTLVVCSGVKSILDIGRTLEYLETQGVCVCAFGETDDFPAFYTVRSGYRAPHRVGNAKEAARLLQASCNLQLGSGIVVAVPVPREHAMDDKTIEGAIANALQNAESQGIRGKEVTPFILAAVAKATSGASLTANIALIKNNATVGADIAVEYSKLDKSAIASNTGIKNSGKVSTAPGTFVRRFHSSSRVYGYRSSEDAMFGPHRKSDGDVLVIGGSNVDRTYRVTEEQVQLDGSTHACVTRMCGGGVGRNIAEALWRLRHGRARLLTVVGDDADGQYLRDIAPGLMLDGCVVPGARTASYAAVLDSSGECRLGLGDMTVHNHVTPELVEKHKAVLENAPLVVLDGNVPQRTLNYVLQLCHQMNKPDNLEVVESMNQTKKISKYRSNHQLLNRSCRSYKTNLKKLNTMFFEPTDRRKATAPLHSTLHLSFASPNLAELRAMASFINPNLSLNKLTDIDELLYLSNIVTHRVDFLIVTLGSKGILTARQTNNTGKSLTARLYHVEVLNSVQNVSGAGDCFASGFINGILSGSQEPECIYPGFISAKCALLSENTIPLDLKITDDKQSAQFEEFSWKGL